MAHALRYLIVAMFVALVGTLRAQPAAPEQRVRFTVFSSRPAEGLAYVARTGQPAAPVTLYPTARSPRYEWRGVMPLRLLDAKTGAVLAEATVPPAITEALLLLVPLSPAPATGLRYQVYVLDDTAARLAPGRLAIINLSGLALAGTLGEQPVALAAGLNSAQPVNRATSLVLRTTLKGRSFQSYTGTLDLAKNERALLLLLPPFYKGSLEVQSRLLVDTPPTAAR